MRKPRQTTTQPVSDAKWYMVTDPIEGHVNNKSIKAKRGDQIQLTPDQAKLFKDRILEINHGLLTGQ